MEKKIKAIAEEEIYQVADDEKQNDDWDSLKLQETYKDGFIA